MDYFKIITLNDKRIAVYKTGEIVFWDTVKNQHHDIGWNIHSIHKKKEYIYYKINKIEYRHHRIVAYAFLGLDIEDKKSMIDHINGIRDDNRLENLRIVNNQQNNFNRHNAKGYQERLNGKFMARITINKKTIHLGYFDTEEEARNAYLEAKQKYHII